MKQIFKNKNLYLYLLITTLVLWVITLPFHPIYSDEGWMGEEGFWPATEGGFIRLKSFAEFIGYHVHMFVCHKGWILQGAVLTKFFGLKSFLLKSLSGIYFILLLTSLFAWGKKVGWSKNNIYISCILLTISTIVLETSFYFRPEIFVTLLIFNSAMLLAYKSSVRSASLAGMLVGLACFHHLNSTIFGVAGLALLLYRKSYKRFFFFGLTAFIFLLLFFYDVRSIEDLRTLVLHYKFDTALINLDQSSLLQRLLGEYERYFHTVREAVMTFMIIWVFSKSKKYLSHQEKSLLLFFSIAAIVLAIVAHGKNTRYFIYFLPPLYILFLNILDRVDRKKVAYGLLVLLLAANIPGNIQMFAERKNWLSVDEMRDLTEGLPTGAKIIAPYEIFFVVPEREFDFYSSMYYVHIFKIAKQDITAAAFLEKAAAGNRDFIVINNSWNPLKGSDSFSPLKCVRDWCVGKIIYSTKEDSKQD